MRINALIKITLCFTLFFSVMLQFSPSISNAASSKVGYVSISSGVLNVRSGPGSKYKVIGSLKNNASVSVYSQTKDGWSQIGYKKGRAYVSSKYLRMYISYLKDKTKDYTYDTVDEGTLKDVYIGTYNGRQRWVEYPYGFITDEYENSTGLYNSYPDNPDSGTPLKIPYPLKVGKEWANYGLKNKIISINETVKTKVGTFKNVVSIKSDGGFTFYYAPNVGFIKSTQNGKTAAELIKLANKK